MSSSFLVLQHQEVIFNSFSAVMNVLFFGVLIVYISYTVKVDLIINRLYLVFDYIAS